MRRVLVVQQSIEPPGGGNGVGAWMIEALKHDYRVALLTWAAPDLDAINRFFATALSASDIELHVMPRALRGLFATTAHFAFLRDALLLRRARRLAADFDLVISSGNEGDVGRRGIQYVHYPRFDPERPAVDLRWYHWSPLVRAYRAAVLRATGTSLARVRRNLTLVNSEWCAARVRAALGIEPLVLHPPVAGSFPEVPWERRENGFVCIGRLAPEKRLEWVIDCLAAVRARGHDVHLHVVGSDDDIAYAAAIRRRVAAHADWVALDQALPRPALVDLVARHRYGIHGMAEEHFGLAVAEMVQAGCLVFVPDGGGQREIVGADPRLLYRSVEDAADRITAVLADPSAQAALRAALAPRRTAYTADAFTARLRQIVADAVGQ